MPRLRNPRQTPQPMPWTAVRSRQAHAHTLSVFVCSSVLKRALKSSVSCVSHRSKPQFTNAPTKLS